ncbi:MAG TPA: acyltransferase [Flavobacterium sp.]|nr:acyltransferase [Flavobacterium sp.]
MKERLYLPGLNGIRSIAALSVVLLHIVQDLELDIAHPGRFNSFGIYGVTLFFTLSGFLITYLLLKEKEKTGTVHIRSFYIRRILRIWPLYFLFVLIVLVVMRFEVDATLLFYLFMLPNVPWAVGSAGGSIVALPLLNHYWSLGVEEQFYAFWPFVIRWARRLKRTLVVLVVFFVALKFVLKLAGAPATLISLVYYTRFSCMAIGGLGAYLYFKKSRLVDQVCGKTADGIAWLVLITMVLLPFVGIRLPSIVENELVSLVALVIIFNQVTRRSVFSFEPPVFDYLGRISFGLYVYNPLVLYATAWVFSVVPMGNALRFVVVALVTVPAIILVAHISYFYFEKRFLDVKRRFATVDSAGSRSEVLEQP